tara:strand:+ start:80 stop:382 length:303 start_codon:yes stop_codon:yes gene_type:complete
MPQIINMDRLKTLILGLCFMITLSLFWLSSIWSRFGFSDPLQTTEHILSDIKWLGPASFIFDILFFYFIYKIILPKQEEALFNEFINDTVIDDSIKGDDS